MADAWREPAPRHAPARNLIHYVRSEGGENQTQGASTSGRTRSTRLRAEEEENQIHQAYAGGREPHPSLMREENQNTHHGLNRRKPAPFNRHQQRFRRYVEKTSNPLQKVPVGGLKVDPQRRLALGCKSTHGVKRVVVLKRAIRHSREASQHTLHRPLRCFDGLS